MLKVLLFMKKKAGLTDEQFRHHYETSHAPLAEKYLGRYMAEYRRNYRSGGSDAGLPGSASAFEGSAGEAPFDVITEIWFHDRENFEAMWVAARQPEIAAATDADAEHFLEPGSFRAYVVDEARSTLKKG